MPQQYPYRVKMRNKLLLVVVARSLHHPEVLKMLLSEFVTLKSNK